MVHLTCQYGADLEGPPLATREDGSVKGDLAEGTPSDQTLPAPACTRRDARLLTRVVERYTQPYLLVTQG